MENAYTHIVNAIGIVLLVGTVACLGFQALPQDVPEIVKQYHVSCKRHNGEVIYEGPVVERPRADPTLRLFVFTTPEGVDFALPMEYCVSNSVPETDLGPMMFEPVNKHGEG